MNLNLNQSGVVSIFVFLFLAILLILGSYFLSSAALESELSRKEKQGLQTYYLAEAGINEAIWKLKNDPSWKNQFEQKPTLEDPSCSSWSIPSFSREGFFENGTYTVEVENLGCAKANLISTAQLRFSDENIIQKKVRVKVLKAMGETAPILNYAIFTGVPPGDAEPSGDIRITTGPFYSLDVHSGSVFSNHDIKISSASKASVEGFALAVNDIDESLADFTALGKCSANKCGEGCPEVGNPPGSCPPGPISMPRLDFDSEIPDDGIESYLELAKAEDCSLVRTDGETNCYFTEGQFENLMWDNYPDLSLPAEVIYIDGDLNIRAAQKITMNGVIAVANDIKIGKDRCWTKLVKNLIWHPVTRCGSSQLEINSPGENKPSGLVSKEDIVIGDYLLGEATLKIQGLIYSGSEIKFEDITAPVEIIGGIVAREFSFGTRGQADIHLDSEIAENTFRNPIYSPVITINYWEELYQ